MDKQTQVDGAVGSDGGGSQSVGQGAGLIVNELTSMDETHTGWYCDGHVPFALFAEAILREMDMALSTEEYVFKHRYMKFGRPIRDEYQPMSFLDTPKKGFHPVTQAIPRDLVASPAQTVNVEERNEA